MNRDTARPDVLEATLEARPGGILGEEAFHELLAIERTRAGRSTDSLRLLLVSLKPGPRQALPIKPSVAARLFAGLDEAVRETDVVGWYREGRVAGAVLIDPTHTKGLDGCSAILQRVNGMLEARLPSTLARQLHVRAVPVRPKPAGSGKRSRRGQATRSGKHLD